MNKYARLIIAYALCLLFSQPALSLDEKSRNQLISPGARSLINLGNAGLLGPFFSNEKFGFAQSRMGAARFAYGASGSNPELSDFREENTVLINPVNLMLELPSSVGASYLRVNAARTAGNSDPHALELESNLYHGEIQYLHLPDIDTMWGIGIVANNFESEDQLSDTKVIRDSLGLRLDYLKKFSDHWGLATRGMYLWGETENRVYDIPTSYGPADLRKKQDDNRYYLQADMVGSYYGDTVSWLPGGTLAHPRLGALYHHSDLDWTTPRLGNVELPKETGVDGPDEDFGLVWAHFRLQKAPRPTPGLQWLPSVMLGIEHEYENSLTELNDEDTYGIIGAGLTVTMYGQGVFINYKRHQGLQGDREDNVIVTGLTLSF